MTMSEGDKHKRKLPRREARFTTASAEETQRLGERLGSFMQSGHLLLLTGDLGVGKTTFSKGVGRGLGVKDEMTSPTFTLIAEYEGRVPVAHMDLYRMAGNRRHLEEVGWDDYLESEYAVLVEWPMQGVQGLDDTLHVLMERTSWHHFHERALTCHAIGPQSTELLRKWVDAWQS